MSDAHDKAAKALDAEIRETLPPLLRPSTLLEDGLMLQIIAAALRKAAADEREACAQAVYDTEVVSIGREFMRQDDAQASLNAAEKAIRARAKGGA